MRSLNVTTLYGATLLALAGCTRGHSGVPIRVDGSPGVLPLVATLARAYTSSTGGTFTLASGLGSSQRASAVANGAIDIAMASHGIDSADIARRGLAVHEIARTAVVFAVNAGVPLTGLTRTQVCEILAGRVANWDQLDASTAPIVPLVRPPAEVDAEIARAHVPCLRDVAPGPVVRVIERPDSMAAELARTPGAFGVTSLVLVQGSAGHIRALALDGVSPTTTNVRSRVYPMARSSYLITRHPPPPHVARFLDFIRDTGGARVIMANGAVPVDH